MLAVRPPEYFPGLSYVALGAQVTAFVLADTFQYSRQSYQNRSKLRNPQGWQWISVPLQSRPPKCRIAEVCIENHEPWQRKHWRALEYNYRSTPYFEFFEPELGPLVQGTWTHLADLTCATTRFVFEQFGIDTDILRASELPGAPATLEAILEEVGREPLVSPPEAARHDAGSGSAVRVASFEEPTYRQNFEGFEPGMSAVDLLFNYGPRGISSVREGTRITAFDA